MSFMGDLGRRILVFDGGMGTRLAELGYDRIPYCLANLEAPNVVVKAHKEFVEAGADAVETNTFWANRYRLGAEDVRRVCLEGARLAREAAGERVYVIGAISQCGKPLAPIGPIDLEEARQQFVQQAEALTEGGVDAIILESFSDLTELEIAITAVKSVCDLPVIACKSFIEDGETLAEGLPLRVAISMLNWGADIVGANCVVGPQRMLDIVRSMSEIGDTPICALPTPGMPQLVKGQPIYDVTPQYFGKAAARLADAGANIVGGCCGVSPEHIRALVQALPDRTLKVRAHAKRASQAAKAPIPQSKSSELSGKIAAGRFIITVELDLPKGLDPNKILDGAKALKQRGCDLIDISDGARARLRMAPVAICSMIQNEVGIEAMMHVACRDRNLLALQSDMIGAHVLGIRNVLPITGDPANIGDYPSATSVFDIDSIGLVRILSRFNQGLDMAGNSLGRKCAFTIAVAFNPNARDIDTELDRLKRKVDAGAHIVYTQPLFEENKMEFAVQEVRKLGLPIFIGVLPLRSHRHAEFMHNEVPGIVVPDWLRKKMAEAPEDSAAEVGIQVAQKFAQRVAEVAQGLYLMPPFGNHEVAIRVMEAVGRCTALTE